MATEEEEEGAVVKPLAIIEPLGHLPWCTQVVEASRTFEIACTVLRDILETVLGCPFFHSPEA